MNTIFKLILFSLMLNAATGIMMNAIVDSEGKQVFDGTNPTETGSLTYNSSYNSGISDNMGGVVQPTGDLENKGDSTYRILDLLNIGFIFKFFNAINSYLFGFIVVIQNIFAPWLGNDVSVFIFGIFKGILLVAYIIAGFLMWTDKDIMN